MVRRFVDDRLGAMTDIVFDHVSVTRGPATVLGGVSVALTERRIAVLGANGSGKTTFVKLLNGLVRPTGGRVTVDGLDVAREADSVRRRVGFVFQNPDHQIVFPIVREDLAFGLRNRGVGKPEIDRRTEAALARLGIAHLAERQAHTLSGGETQLVALAAVLVTEPSLIVFDEPTTQLDLGNRNRLRGIIGGLAEDVVLATHDLELALDCDRALVIADGRIGFDGPPGAAVAWYVGRCA